MVFQMPVHMPVEKFCNGIKCDGTYALSEVRDVAAQAAMHWHADKVPVPIANEDASRNKDRQYWFSNSYGDHNHRRMKEQHQSSPPNSLRPFRSLSRVKLRAPGIHGIIKPIQGYLDKALQRRN